MKTFTFFALSAIILLAGTVQHTIAMSLPPPDRSGGITLQGHLNTTCMPYRGGTVYLHMDVITPDLPHLERSYQPMNIAVVLDRSGSMADERKMEYAKQAVISLIDRLSTNDYLSIVIYDDRIETLLPPQRIKDRSAIRRLVQEIFPRGSTNLGGGMGEGFRQIERNFKLEYINRVILLSDGLANQGITDPQELNRIVRRYRDQSISLSTMGVGLDFNENLMLGLAEQGGGNYYFIESPSQLASIFENELNGISSVVAQNASIVLSLGNGIILNDVIGCRWNRDGDRWIIPLGDLYANGHRELTVALSIPEGTGNNHVATGTLIYDGARNRRNDRPGFSIDIRYSDVTAELEKGKDWDTQAKVDIAISTKSVERALKAIDEGRREEAAQELTNARSILSSSPAMLNSPAHAEIVGQQLQDLDQYTSDAKNEKIDIRKLKKSLQYNNYKTQKKK